MSLEYCCECDEETGNAGRGEDSLFIEVGDAEVGPLCSSCYGNQAADTIETLQSKLTALEAELDDAGSGCTYHAKIIADLQAENERLEAENINLSVDLLQRIADSIEEPTP